MNHPDTTLLSVTTVGVKTFSHDQPSERSRAYKTPLRLSVGVVLQKAEEVPQASKQPPQLGYRSLVSSSVLLRAG